MWRAVIIDDDNHTLKGLSNSIEWNAYEIEIVGLAKNGEEGLMLVREHDPHIILTDIYMPRMNGIEMLQHIRDDKNEAEVIILSGYQDFEYARSAVKLDVEDYLSKPVTLEEIHRVVDRTVKKLGNKNKQIQEEKMFNDFIENNLPITQSLIFKGFLEGKRNDSPYLHNILKNVLNIDPEAYCFTVFIIEIGKSHTYINYSSSDWSLVQYAVNNVANEIIENNKNVYIIENHGNLITLLFFAPRNMFAVQAEIERLGKYKIQAFKDYLKIQSWVAVGSTVENLHEIRNSYNEAMNLLAERDNIPDRDVLTKENLETKTVNAFRRPIESYHSIIHHVINGESDLAKQKSKELIEHLSEINNFNLTEVRNIGIEFFGILITSLYNQGTSMESIHSEVGVYKEVSYFHSIRDLEQWITRLIDSVCGKIINLSTTKHSKTIDFMKQYVNQHYNEEITLDIISEKVFFTKNYLSQIFKQDTGENFKNYLTRVRMEKAKELMQNSHLKIYEIAEVVGYNNTTYFSQLFKKYTGLNPSDFNQ